MTQTRYAAIDIGSNAIRLAVVSIIEDVKGNSFKTKKISLTRVPIRLGEDVFGEGVVSEAKFSDLLNAMEGFSSLIKAYRVTKFKACATSAMRGAKNGNKILAQIKKTSGIDIEIINGKQEAEYIFNAGIEKFLKEGKNYLYIDVGGGSTELSLLIDGDRKASASFQLGTVRILKKGWQKEEWSKMKNWIHKYTKNVKFEAAIGSGGNINSYYKMSSCENKLLKFKELQQCYSSLKALTYNQRMVQFSLKYDRADVIVPAGKIFLNILNETNIKNILVPKLGLADGIINEMVSEQKN